MNEELLPLHLRENAPWAQCNLCGRKSWVEEALIHAHPCDFPQLDGRLCTGIMCRPKQETK